MANTYLPGQGLMLEGHLSRTDAIAAARQYLVDHGTDPMDADDALVDQPGLVARAWFADGPGFVQNGHPGAAPVTVVHINVDGAP